jgi:hypothetical protein
MVVDGENLHRFAALVQVARAVEDGVDGPAGLLAVHAIKILAAAGGTQVVETGAVDALALDEVEDGVEILAGLAGERESESDFLADIDAMAEAFHGFLEGAFHAAEPVMHFGEGAVEADADVGELEFLELLGDFAGDERAVGGEHDVQSLFAGVGRQLEHVLAHERFAAGEQYGRDLEFGEVVEHGLALFRGQFARIALGFGGGVAMLAVEIAGPGEIPDDDGPALPRAFGLLHPLMLGRINLGDLAPVAVGRAGSFQSTIENADINHD